MPACKITVNANGAIRIEGDFELLDSEGRPYGLGGRTRLALCRCGASKNRPFCDGTHNTVGFRDPATARDLPPPSRL
jgi:CDGSH-type Zn-finger protein